ncbi:hypothetical protein BDP27DRAFT_1430086 [Rhodocollybia butyracea]|uniref:Uncharacterized protein n=1 Tax=Rhodocollybia butyracea TaxID=206335 RepID=A0A9P5TZK7_9AGAR|nr:hypothetical protein BDP27DRAFT_1430086 [Rhodocollybia butyracea]
MASSSKRCFDHIQHPHPHSPATKHTWTNSNNQDQEEFEFPTWKEMFLEPMPLPSLMFEDFEVKEQALMSSELFTFPEDVDAADDKSIKPVIATLEELGACTHETSQELKQAMHEGKGSATAYRPHFGNYATFLGQEHPTLLAILVAAAEVALFLGVERKRPKRTHNRLDIPGTRVGFEHLKQCISALEYYWFNHKHEFCYKADPASQIPLRDDMQIKTFRESS